MVFRKTVALRGTLSEDLAKPSMYAANLVSLLNKEADFDISVAAYPIGEILVKEDLAQLQLQNQGRKTAVHCPCSLQHGQQLGGLVEQILQQADIELTRTKDGHRCCGSAGTYSIQQPAMSQKLH